MADLNTSYDEFTLNFRLEEDVPVDQSELTIFNYEFVGNRTTRNIGLHTNGTVVFVFRKWR